MPNLRVLSISSRVAVPCITGKDDRKVVRIEYSRQRLRQGRHLFETHYSLFRERVRKHGREGKRKKHTSLINGISNALETNPGTSFEVVTSLYMHEQKNMFERKKARRKDCIPFPQAVANALARDSVSVDVWRAEMSSTSFYA